MTEEKDEFSNYGIYSITESTEFKFPDTEVKFLKISDNVFSYQRKDSEDNLIEKSIPSVTGNLKIEICPIRPLNHPARRTSYVYLSFETPVFLIEGSAATIFARCPIEIGVFLLHEDHKDSLDWFTCDPQNSRYSLYGAPESGSLCKFSSTPIVSSYDDSTPYLNGIIKMQIKNELSGGHSITRVVFPITSNSVYYKGNKAIFDGVSAVLRRRITHDVIDVISEKIQTDWSVSPTYEKSTDIKHSEMGVD